MTHRKPHIRPSTADVRAKLIREFRSSRLCNGQTIESVRTIAERFGISKSAAQKAVRSLVADGICRAEHGRGVMSVRHRRTAEWSPPIFVKLTGAASDGRLACRRSTWCSS